ncbi:hypothetical protein SADUNF_Sadunf13G0081800 [Salix dunnii]|uniref:LysM domain-containing protein n=1 Tax=Salix dunnii TaxID=1413687 RepID=A0A835JJR8_9ROSI|nr:hypothetical protein SADUNF_Sadunf13G0081800 [Salix dunnii]
MMEVKLSHRRHFSDLFLPRFHFPNPKTTFPSPSLKWWVNSKKHFTVLAEVQSFSPCFVCEPLISFVVSEMEIPYSGYCKGSKLPQSLLASCGQRVITEIDKTCKAKDIFLYSKNFYGRGETLTSISKQYGVSRYSVSAANKNILDVDLVFEGQFLNIPASAPADTQVYQVKKCELPSFDHLKRLQNSMKIMDGVLNRKPFIMLTTHHLPHAKATGYFLVLVPAFAFCIRCVIGAFQTRACRNLGYQAPNESRRHHDVPESKRWKHALGDIREPDNLDGEPILNSTGSSADQDQNSFEEVSNAYDKLELEYQNFLSECGISNSGYWRGGSAG